MRIIIEIESVNQAGASPPPPELVPSAGVIASAGRRELDTATILDVDAGPPADIEPAASRLASPTSVYDAGAAPV